jgi:SSS family solute:Na+ symporter
MIGSIWAAVYVIGLPEVGGLDTMLSHENVREKLRVFPTLFTENENGRAINPQIISLLFVPLAVQWWAAWYPGSEPGGGGYIAQRMLSARNERHAMGATLLFNAAHYALRPWPWILIALASLGVSPDLDALADRFPEVPDKILKDDLAYPAMLATLPPGLLGVVVASLIAAFMSTISTHLNWGSSYIVNDFYKRFLKPDATEKELVRQGRLSTVVLVILAGIMGLTLEDATQAFQLILMLGAGTGLIYILRWFWWRINPAGEITAMVASLVVSVYFNFLFESNVPDVARTPPHVVLLISVTVTTLAWLVVTWLTPPTDDRTLYRFYRLVKPGGPGWKAVVEKARRDNELLKENTKGWDVPAGILCMLLGCLCIYGALFATGSWIYGNYGWAVVLTATAIMAAGLLIKTWAKLKID